MDKSRLLKQFTKPDEKLSFAKVLDQVFVCEEKHFNTFTEFLDPYRCKIFCDTINKNMDIGIKAFGGGEGCERQVIGFYPYYKELGDEEFPIDKIQIEFSKSASKKLSHKDFLGSILGIGLDRGKIGDIFLYETRAIVFVSRNISDYIEGNLKTVGKTAVHTSIIQDDFLLAPAANHAEKDIFSASLRLDGVISAGFSLSRGNALKLIQADKAQVNWIGVKNPSHTVSAGDIITLRGYGRITLKEINTSKKGNYAISINKLG